MTRTHFQPTSSDFAGATCSDAALHTGTTKGQRKTVLQNPDLALPGQGSPACVRGQIGRKKFASCGLESMG
jgi:hypothetical protein